MSSRSLPPITLAVDEADRLSDLAGAAARVNPELATFLERELSRAALVSAARMPPNVVRLGSHVAFRDDDGTVAEVILVLPEEADVGAGKVSVLTPVGAALIGMRVGKSITFPARRGTRRITVLSVADRRVAAGDAR